MTERIYFDTLTVSSGPEDGMKFNITSTPVLVGRSPDCLINLQLDVTIQPEHAAIELGNGGYRVRRLTGAPVLVDGRRAGRIRSRSLNHGSVLRIGYTDFVMQYAEGGHAATGSPAWGEHDVAWALRSVLGVARGAAAFCFARAKNLARFAAAHWFWSLAILAAIAYVTLPPVREWAHHWVTQLRARL